MSFKGCNGCKGNKGWGKGKGFEGIGSKGFFHGVNFRDVAPMMIRTHPQFAACAAASTGSNYDGHVTTCAICISEFATNDLVARLGCRHVFHRTCYDLLLSKVKIGRTPQCPVCRGAEPVVATYRFKGRDGFDDILDKLMMAESDLLNCTLALDRACDESLDLKKNLECEMMNCEYLETLVERSKVALKTYQDLYRHSQEELCDLELVHKELQQKHQQTYKDAANKRNLAQVRAILSEAGGKCHRLAQNRNVGLCTLAHAAVAQNRKLGKLLSKVAGEAKEAKEEDARLFIKQNAAKNDTIASLKKKLADSKEAQIELNKVLDVEKKELSELKIFVKDRESQVSKQIKTHEDSIALLTKQLDKSIQKGKTLEQNLQRCKKKGQRSKDLTVSMYNEIASLKEQLLAKECQNAVLASRNAVLEGEIVSLEKKIPQCAICMASSEMVCFTPCGHAAACVACSQKVAECPICRANYTEQFPIYFASE